jgi:hypothetical protein
MNPLMKVILVFAALWLVVLALGALAPKPIDHVPGQQGFGDPASLSEVAPGACDLWMGSKHAEASYPVSAIKTSDSGSTQSYEVTCSDGTVVPWYGNN